jgi:potassium-transporting ATPase KdpC subunit
VGVTPARVRDQVRPAILSVLVLTLVAGMVFPLLLFVVGRALFPRQAEGSLLRRGGLTIGSRWIGQEFTRAEYFHPRPSAAGNGYDATQSGGTNLGPNNPQLAESLQQFAEQYRRRNGLARDAKIPMDAVTRSASGLDPHISPANAALQIPRVARARGWNEETVRRLVAQHTDGRQLGFLGEPRVSVLELNLALDSLARH